MAYKDRREYMKAYYQAHREEKKAYKKAHREELKAYQKAYTKAHKKERKAWEQAHREDIKAYQKAYKKAYNKSDTNSLGDTKQSIRVKSSYYLFKVLNHPRIEGYEIHHCFGYEDYKKFIYIPKELHLQIHQFLRDNGIDADSNHYSKIEHLIVNYLKLKERHVLIMDN